MSLFLTIVLDGVGIGEAPDAGYYNDQGSHTLGHICAHARPFLPNLEALGLGAIVPLQGIRPPERPHACFGRLQEVSAGKDSTTGHWELAGLHLDRPFPTYPEGFPSDVVHAFLQATGYAGILGNKPASGTAIIEELGEEHQRTGWPIVYTSADSVFQVAAHTDTLPLDELYRICRIARDEICRGMHAVGRVIARPFAGTPGAYVRRSAARHDYALQPPPGTIQSLLQAGGVHTVSIGKVFDLFDGVGFDETHPTSSNQEGITRILTCLREAPRDRHTFIWVNLVDFDQEFGHRNDLPGFAGALEAFDAALPDIRSALPADGCLFITADHGNDPFTPSTDHSREYVPVLLLPPIDRFAGSRDRGIHVSFSAHAATVASFFGVPARYPGRPFVEFTKPG